MVGSCDSCLENLDGWSDMRLHAFEASILNQTPTTVSGKRFERKQSNMFTQIGIHTN